MLCNVDRQAQSERASQEGLRKGALSLSAAGRLRRRARRNVSVSSQDEALVLPRWISDDPGGSGRSGILRVLFFAVKGTSAMRMGFRTAGLMGRYYTKTTVRIPVEGRRVKLHSLSLYATGIEIATDR